MEKGSFISINYIGKVKDTGEIFDLTDEEVAKREKIFNPKVKYGPITIVTGAGFTIRGLDEALTEMKVGEKKTVTVAPDKAFGERSAQLIKLIPVSVFQQQNITAEPGRYVNINGINGRVVSVDGGRIRVDFNHPLAGKALEYGVEIVAEVKDSEKKILSIVTFLSGFEAEKFGMKIEKTSVEINVKGAELNGEVKKRIADEILKWITDVGEVKFVDVYSK